MTQDTKYPQPSLINPFELFKMNPSFGLKNTHKKSKEPKQLSFTFLFLLCSLFLSFCVLNNQLIENWKLHGMANETQPQSHNNFRSYQRKSN